ncbi:hypothetical protein B296_00012131 [Ensete ventricosum]|uniref:Uncharacterized protein n=1 Tax=Ensete ventricosum TaxID=4639 RepID=A0A427ACR0_ENSVE|nr:hypothetical protein B296_00012131 [Ensete ventricosum]
MQRFIDRFRLCNLSEKRNHRIHHEIDRQSQEEIDKPLRPEITRLLRGGGKGRGDMSLEMGITYCGNHIVRFGSEMETGLE